MCNFMSLCVKKCTYVDQKFRLLDTLNYLRIFLGELLSVTLTAQGIHTVRVIGHGMTLIISTGVNHPTVSCLHSVY